MHQRFNRTSSSITENMPGGYITVTATQVIPNPYISFKKKLLEL